MNKRLKTILSGLKMSPSTWFILFLFFIVATGIIKNILSPDSHKTPYKDHTTLSPQTPRAPDPIALKRQRITEDKLGAADLARIEKIEPVDFCWKELPKIRTSKLNSPQIEARMLIAYRYGASQAEQEHIQQKTVFVGMSECGATASWGRPQTINSSIRENYKHDQWVFGSGNYLYMRNNKISSMQTSR